MLDYWKQRDLNGLLAILKVGPREIVRMGIIDWDGKEIKRIVEKPTLDEAPSNFGSMPLYVFSPHLLEYLPRIKPSPRGELELQDSIHSLIAEEGAVHGLILPDRIDLTLPKDLLRLNLHYLNKDVPQTETALDKVGKNTYFTNPVVIDEGVIIGADCAIGPNVYLEKGCTIEDNVQLEDCVVLRDTVVLENSKINNQVFW